MTNNLFNGATYLIDGFNLIFKPGIRRFIVIPFILNIILITGLFFLGRHFFQDTSHWLVQHLPHWLHWLGTILGIIFALIYFVFIIYSFVTLSNIVSSPFNSYLSEKVELYLTGQKIEQDTHFIKDIPRVVGRQLSILGYYIPRAIGLLLLFFVPLIQIVAAFIWFLFSAWFMTLQSVDYPTDLRHIPVSRVRDKLGEKRWLALGFGITFMLLAMIPIINFFVLQAAVAGATKMWLEEYQ